MSRPRPRSTERGPTELSHVLTKSFVDDLRAGPSAGSARLRATDARSSGLLVATAHRFARAHRYWLSLGGVAAADISVVFGGRRRYTCELNGTTDPALTTTGGIRVRRYERCISQSDRVPILARRQCALLRCGATFTPSPMPSDAVFEYVRVASRTCTPPAVPVRSRSLNRESSMIEPCVRFSMSAGDRQSAHATAAASWRTTSE